MWRLVAPQFEDTFKVVLLDHLGHGDSDIKAFDPQRYATLGAYASDVVDICHTLDLTGAVLVGHSIGASIATLAAVQKPDLFDKLVLVGPSPRYINDGTYVGGFEPAAIHDMLDFLDSNHLGWSRAMAPIIMGNTDRPELGEELTNSFCRTDPEIAKHFARLTFLSDTRAALPNLKVPSLILQSDQDAIAPVSVGTYVHDHIAGSELIVMEATGHCPHLSAPDATVAAIKRFLGTPTSNIAAA
jgi:sigma-B regulation protein RsbQ